MNADDLRRPLTARERAALEESCARSGVPVKVTDPVAIGRVAALLHEDLTAQVVKPRKRHV